MLCDLTFCFDEIVVPKGRSSNRAGFDFLRLRERKTNTKSRRNWVVPALFQLNALEDCRSKLPIHQRSLHRNLLNPPPISKVSYDNVLKLVRLGLRERCVVLVVKRS
jgi:hypothetical protein